MYRLNDENCSYRNEAQNWWHEIGLQYVKENDGLLKDKYELLPIELENYPFDGNSIIVALMKILDHNYIFEEMHLDVKLGVLSM